jgi:two-component system response regulator WspF
MKVGIVNDSRMAAEILRRIVTSLPEFTVAWIAYSGEEALTRCAEARPDIVLMDLIMPGIDGVETTRRMMKTTPCVILVVTATTVGNRDMVFEAMGCGALDAVNTPALGSGPGLEGADTLIQKLRTVSRLVVHRESRPRVNASGNDGPPPDDSGFPVVAIGASTGGPQALAETFSHLPAEFPAIVLVVQHVDAHFTPGLAAWLQHYSRMPVAIARHGERLSPGGVWLAGGKENLVYRKGTAFYEAPAADAVHSPSIDMGRDGAAGLLAMRKSRALTIAQDEATSVVYGMPKAAAELGAAAEILPLSEVGPRISQAVLGLSPNEGSASLKSLKNEANPQPSRRAVKIPKTTE